MICVCWPLHCHFLLYVCILTLDIIIKCAESVTVFIENTKCIAVGKIFKLNKTIHPVPKTNTHKHKQFWKCVNFACLYFTPLNNILVSDGLHELINEVIIFFAPHSFVLQTNVQGIIQEGLTKNRFFYLISLNHVNITANIKVTRFILKL